MFLLQQVEAVPAILAGTKQEQRRHSKFPLDQQPNGGLPRRGPLTFTANLFRLLLRLSYIARHLEPLEKLLCVIESSPQSSWLRLPCYLPTPSRLRRLKTNRGK